MSQDNPTSTDIIAAISDKVQTGLDRKSIEALVTLMKQGVHPDALAQLVLELNKTVAQQEEESGK